MDLEKFNAGRYIQQHGYRSFTPATINHPWTWKEARINMLLANANRHLGELNAFSVFVPDIDIFIRMHSLKEATTSSRIEGTRTAIDEAMQRERDIQPNMRDDWKEVRNYIAAMNHAVKRMRRIALSTRLLKETHAHLMSGVRGRSKLPGEYRKSQNWIGGATISDASYIPPQYTEIGDLMGDLENFLHDESRDVPHLVKAAIAHYQFEAIHPFLDGNGRIGRLMITLYLVGTGLLTKPALYLSQYIEKHRGLYYDVLTQTRQSNNLGPWVKFFLTAVSETAQSGSATLRSVLSLKEKGEVTIVRQLGRRAPRGLALLQFLYKMPFVAAIDIQKALDVSVPTANALIEDFVNAGILRETTGRARDRLFVFEDYVKLFADRNTAGRRAK